MPPAMPYIDVCLWIARIIYVRSSWCCCQQWRHVYLIVSSLSSYPHLQEGCFCRLCMLAFVCHTAKERKHKQAFYGDVGRNTCFYDTVLCRYFLRLTHFADAVVGLAACCGADVHLSCVQNKSCVCHFCGCLAYFYNICRTGMGVLYHKRSRMCRLGVIKICLNFLPDNHLNYAPVVCLSKHGKWPSKRYAFAA